MIKYITANDWAKIEREAKEARDAVPAGHCRLRDKAYHKAIIDGVKACKARTEGKAAAVICTASHNYGTRKWADMGTVASEYPVRELRETEKAFILQYGLKIYKSRVLALVKA